MDKLIKGVKAYRSIPVSIKSIDAENYRLTMVASTQDVDRHGDTVMQDGWDLTQFVDNPVILNSHNYGDATEVIARAENIAVEGKGKRAKLVMDWVFAVNENPKAKIIFDLYANDFLHASSVGFIPRKFAENPDGTRNWYIIEEAELLEVSAVSVPANARALAKAKGIDIDSITLNYDEDGNNGQSETGTDEVPTGDEIPPTDGQLAPTDSDNSDSGSGTSDADGGIGEGGEDGTDKPDTTGTDETGDTPSGDIEKSIVVRESQTKKMIRAINAVNEKERDHLKKAVCIVNSLLNDNATRKVTDAKVAQQIRKRKINQAIRELIKSK